MLIGFDGLDEWESEVDWEQLHPDEGIDEINEDNNNVEENNNNIIEQLDVDGNYYC